MPNKQSRELYLLERFLPALLENQPYTVLQPAPPLPDAIVEIDGRKIGIETTTLIANGEISRREGDQDKILNEAQKQFEKQCQMPLHVSVSFAESANWHKINRQQIASFVTDIVIRSISEVKELAQYKSYFSIRKDRLSHDYIRSIGISYSDKLTIPCWSPITSFMVPDAPVDTIQSIISRKSKNLQGYLSGCDEVWLLLLETGSPSSYYDGFDKLNEHTFTSSFSRTLIGRIPNGEVIELQTQSVTNSPESHS
ncbi:hypothetical protein I2I05_09945 [Hymenobacter sp. BT683]|uniref:Uncharacterized protein n=1 Tax=Hymenobacter jeongseonensis TaxID=2791027 RepID=A0ABS0IH88_9BACT|nr:hypothetical protein [Hymenobacter jeongseonensis]MBF9237714.1 hypothetical protein [Hymenobacter jeongseonensis]